jgi:hypothetical protein
VVQAAGESPCARCRWASRCRPATTPPPTVWKSQTRVVIRTPRRDGDPRRQLCEPANSEPPTTLERGGRRDGHGAPRTEDPPESLQPRGARW